MRNRPVRLLLLAVTWAAAALVVACGGGGGGASVTPVATPTPTPTQIGNVGAACNAASVGNTNAANCTYTFQSNSAGTAVYVDGSLIGMTGATPIATSLPFSVTPHTVQFGSTSGSAYAVTIDQHATGSSRTVYYNAAVDTGSGASMTGNQSAGRSTQSVVAESLRGPRAAKLTNWIVPDKVYVRYDSSKLSGRSVAQIEASAGSDRGYDVLASIAAVRGRIVHVPSGTSVATLTARLQQDGAVLGVYPVHYRVPLNVPNPPATEENPNDPYFDGGHNGIGHNGSNAACLTSTSPLRCQWDMQITHADYAWYYTQGAHATIAVLDTGADLNHPDITNQVAFEATTAGTNGMVETTTGAAQAYTPGGAVTNATSPPQSTYGAAQDTNGHGTNVSGIADAETNDGNGFAGVAYGGNGTKNLYLYRIFPPATSSSDQQSADTGDEATAIADAVSRSVDVINLSIGAPQASGGIVGFDQTEHDAVEAAISAGVTVVAAAGNESATTLDFPAGYDGVISVGATSLDDGQPNGSGTHQSGTQAHPIEYVSSFSNSGPGLSLVAPGGDPVIGNDNDYLHWIFNGSTATAALSSDQCTSPVGPGDVCKALFAGTSQATPHVTGAVAMIQSALREEGRSALSPAAMLQLLEGTADNINDPNQGHGRLNVLRAMESALGFSLTLPAPASSKTQFVAFAYTTSGAVNPTLAQAGIADVFYTGGVPVSTNGAFRIADILPSTGTFKIAVWLDSNGDGKIDAGDQFGVAAGTCTGSSCHPTFPISVSTIPAGNFALP